MSEQMNSQNPQRGGRHRLDDDYDDYGYDDGYVPPSHPTDEYREVRYGSANEYPEVETQYAAAQAAEADYAEAAADDDFDEDDAKAGAGAGAVGGGKSLRALAFVCVLIALLLVAYGIYAFVNSKSDDANSGSGDSTSEMAPAPGNGKVDSGISPTGPSTAPNTGLTNPDGSTPPPPADPNAPAPAPEPPAPPAPAEIDRAAFPITVLNNTTEQSLAANTATTLSDEGWRRGEVGNIPEEEARMTETTVFFTPDNAAEKAAAEQIAKDHGWVAAPRDNRLDGKPGGVVVVLAGEGA